VEAVGEKRSIWALAPDIGAARGSKRRSGMVIVNFKIDGRWGLKDLMRKGHGLHRFRRHLDALLQGNMALARRWR